MADAEALASSRRGAMVAAAGFGKTYLLATAVANHGRGRELVLTHTHAGVDAIRGRLREFNVPSRSFHVDTLAGWALRMATAFPVTSGLACPQPRTHDEYSGAYAAAVRVIESKPIREVLRASYTGVYVDEYQDCTVEQHALVLGLCEVLPCRVLGDPLQGIFGFGGNQPIRWGEHVAPHFDEVPGPTNPWRWKDKNPALGEWLREVRERLLRNDSIDLSDAPVRWIPSGSPADRQRQQADACFRAAKRDAGTVVAIHGMPNQCQAVASRLRGVFSCVEAIDTKDLYESAARIDETTDHQRAVAVLDFAAKCMTKVKSPLAGVRAALEKGTTPKGKKFAAQQDALLGVVSDQGVSTIESALAALTQVPDGVLFRRELLHEMVRAVRSVAAGEAATLHEATWIVRNRTRHVGRRLPRCSVGSTLLVKGLEFDHAVVLDGDAHDACNLYVALTRGSKSLTIVSRTRVLQPGPPR